METKIKSFREIPQFTSVGNYEVNMPLNLLENAIQDFLNDHDLQLNPDFQRGHVWSEQQQISFVEYFLSGGITGRILYFNQPDWNKKLPYKDFVIVDGLQRLSAIRRFLNNEIPVYGTLRSEFTDKISMSDANHNLRININNLKTRKEVLSWYMQMNSGGTPHSKEEIERVKQLLEEESK